jgi:hypothetical protein
MFSKTYSTALLPASEQDHYIDALAECDEQQVTEIVRAGVQRLGLATTRERGLAGIDFELWAHYER